MLEHGQAPKIAVGLLKLGRQRTRPETCPQRINESLGPKLAHSLYMKIMKAWWHAGDPGVHIIGSEHLLAKLWHDSSSPFQRTAQILPILKLEAVHSI